MKAFASGSLKIILQIILLYFIILFIGYLLNSWSFIQIRPLELSLLSAAFAINSIVTVLIFLKGRRMDERTGTMYTLVAISLKFLVEMLIALVWFIPAKKTGMNYIVLFFVLYLAFSWCSIIILLNTLKNKSL